MVRSWLLQRDIPPFVADSSVSIESLSLLLIHFLTSFFHSPYLTTCGDRLSSAIALTQGFLQTARDLSNPVPPLPQPLSSRFWCELIRSLADGIRVVTCRSVFNAMFSFIIFMRSAHLHLLPMLWRHRLCIMWFSLR